MHSLILFGVESALANWCNRVENLPQVYLSCPKFLIYCLLPSLTIFYLSSVVIRTCNQSHFLWLNSNYNYELQSSYRLAKREDAYANVVLCLANQIMIAQAY